MFSWLAGQFRSVETAEESLGSTKSIRALIEELKTAPPDRAVRTLGERFEDIPRQLLGAPESRRAVTRLDEYAQVPLAELWESLLTDSRGQSVSEAVWHTLTNYYQKVHRGYWYCLGKYSESESLSAQDQTDATIIASRAMTALGRYMLLLRMCYLNTPRSVWSHINSLIGWVERRGIGSALVEQYPGTGIETTIERELLVTLLIEVAPTANLLPAQMHALDRLLTTLRGLLLDFGPV